GLRVAGSPLVQGGRSTSWERATVDVASMATQLKTANEVRIGNPPDVRSCREQGACRRIYGVFRVSPGPICMARRTDFRGMSIPRAARRRPRSSVPQLGGGAVALLEDELAPLHVHQDVVAVGEAAVED